MIAQQQYVFPYSILDFGLTVLVLLVLGVTVYLFAKLGSQQHKAATEHWSSTLAAMRQVTESLSQLLERDRTMASAIERVHEEVWHSRQLLEKLFSAMREHDDEATSIAEAAVQRDRERNNRTKSEGR